MKRFALIILSLAFAAVFISSCSTDEETQPSFNQAFIIGTWQNNTLSTLFERYDADKSGATWDEGEDVQEDEAQKFTWTITKDELEQIHITETGTALVPKTYTITDLTSTALKYEDDYGVTKSFSKIK